MGWLSRRDERKPSSVSHGPTANWTGQPLHVPYSVVYGTLWSAAAGLFNLNNNNESRAMNDANDHK